VVVSSTGVLSTQPTSTYLTSLTGEATSSGSVVTLTNSAVIGKVLTGVNISSGSITSSDSILSAFGKLQGQIDGLQGGTTYRGSWNAATNTPTIVSSTGNQGDYYVVTTAGTTNINGVSSWAVGDWIIFNGTIWEKIPNVDSITSVNGQTGAVVLTTASITESGNLYYTDTRARNAISLTTSGSSGVATYSSGVLNIPNYTIAGLGGVASSRTLTINGTALDLSADRAWSVGTVTSVNATVPTGFAVGSAVTSSGNIAISFAAGYSLPLTASQTNWDAAYNDKINSAAVTGTTTKTLTLTQQDGGTVTASWTDINTDAVTSVFGRTGAVVATNGDYTTAQVTESGNLYYTEARVNANANVAANTAARHNAVTLGTANGLSLSTQVLSLALASASATGALSSTDWNTFNNKQNALTNPVTGTGTNNYIVKFTGASTVANSIIAESAGLITIYGDGQVYKGQAGSGLTSFFITNDDNTFGNRHETKISTQALGSGLGRTIIQAASNTTSTNRGELSILTESGANYVANIGTIITGVNNAFSLYSTSFSENVRLNTGGDSFINGGNLVIGTTVANAKFQVYGGGLAIGGLGMMVSTGLNNGRLETYQTGTANCIHTVLDSSTYEISAGSTSGWVSGLVITGRNATLLPDRVAIYTRSVQRFQIGGGGQLQLNNYTSVSSFTGTVAGILAFDSSGNVITTNLDGVGGVPTSRTITINGTTQDLSANRTYSVGTVTSVSGTGSVSGLTLTGSVTTSGSLTLGGTLTLTSANVTTALGFTPYSASNPNGYTTNTGTVTSIGLSSSTSGVTIGSSPITTSGTITLSIATASSSQNGLLSSTDWSTFNSKQAALTNPTTGTGTTNYIPKFTGSGTIGNSIMYNDSTNNRIGINIITPDSSLHVTGTFKVDTILGLEQIQTVIQTDTNCNFYVNATQVGANALGTLSMGVGTAPTSSPGNVFQMYSADIVANNAAPHFRTENGAVIKLYQETTSVGNSIFSAGGGSAVLDDSTFDGYTLRQIVKALRNLGILQ
jgi:hypothetical protein